MITEEYPCCKGSYIKPGWARHSRFAGSDYSPSQFLNTFKPKTDILEDEKHIYFQVELPGVVKENLNVQVTKENVLSIEAKREKSSGRTIEFVRRFELPDSLDSASIKADFYDGVLTVTVTKKLPSVKTIDIK